MTNFLSVGFFNKTNHCHTREYTGFFEVLIKSIFSTSEYFTFEKKRGRSGLITKQHLLKIYLEITRSYDNK